MNLRATAPQIAFRKKKKRKSKESLKYILNEQKGKKVKGSDYGRAYNVFASAYHFHF